MEDHTIEGALSTDIDALQQEIDNLALLEPIRVYLDTPVGNFIDHIDIRPNATLGVLRGYVTEITNIINPILVITMHGGLYKLAHDPSVTLSEIGINAGTNIIVHSHKTIGELGDAVSPLDTTMFDFFKEANERAIAEAVAENNSATNTLPKNTLLKNTLPKNTLPKNNNNAPVQNNNNTVYSNISKPVSGKKTYRENLENGREKFSFVKRESTDKTLLRYQKWVNKIYATCEIPWVCKLNDLPFGVPDDWKIPPPNIYKVIYPNESVLAAYNDVVGRPMVLPPTDEVENVHAIYELANLD